MTGFVPASELYDAGRGAPTLRAIAVRSEWQTTADLLDADTWRER